jgi:hypothetical protein
MREVIHCPACQRRLQLPDEALGRLVQCPGCQRTFLAEPSLAAPPAAAAPARAAPVPVPTAAPAPAPRRHDDDDLDIDRLRKRRRPASDDPYDDRPRRRSVAHRGGEILTFGLLALLPCFVTAIIFGLIAWIMANTDLVEMRSGRMDREGEGLTQAGRALGITGLFLWTGLFSCIFVGMVLGR